MAQNPTPSYTAGEQAYNSVVERLPSHTAELRRELSMTIDPARRAVLIAELNDRQGKGPDLPEGTDIRAGQGLTAGPSAPAGNPSGMSWIGKPPLSAGDVAGTKGGAATAIGKPSPTGAAVGVPPLDTPIDWRNVGRTTGRMGIETAGSYLGGTAGAVGTALGAKNPFLVGAGMRVGEGVGAFGGSLLSELFDPTTDPLRSAAEAGGFQIGTGVVASGGTRVLRSLIGKPHEGGTTLIKIAERNGTVPPPGAVLESEFVRQAQSFGSAAFGTSQRLKRARETVEGFTEADARDYVSGFQRFHDSSKRIFKLVDAELAQQGTPIVVNKSIEDALQSTIRMAEAKGLADTLPAGLQKFRNSGKGGASVTPLTFEEAQEVQATLFNQARALDFAARNGDSDAVGLAKGARQKAQLVKDEMDKQVDVLVKQGKLKPEIKNQILEARGAWSKWIEGQELESLLLRATHDIGGNATVSGSKIITELDKLLRESAEAGYKILSPNAVAGMRRYGKALEALEESGKAGQYVFAGRMGQLVMLTGVAGLVLGGANPIGLGGAAMFAAPHVISWAFSNPRASALIIRGMQLKPGTAEAARVARELSTLAVKEGIMPPQRVELPESPESPNVGTFLGAP